MSVFRKYRHPFTPDALHREVEGLNQLRQTLQQSQNPHLKIPQIYTATQTELQLEKIQSRPATIAQMTQLGRGLAFLHQVEQEPYGFGADNYIGLSPQPNVWADNWGAFFLEHRLAYQVARVQDAGIRAQFQNTLNQYQPKLIKFLNTHCPHPSLVHGDLWSGNVLFDAHHVWLIDPAIYHADRAVDIAMTEMFGGFHPAFYQAYDETYPLSSAYPQKKIIYNLYHTLNHYNLFGDSYLTGCQHGFEAIATF